MGWIQRQMNLGIDPEDILAYMVPHAQMVRYYDNNNLFYCEILRIDVWHNNYCYYCSVTAHLEPPVVTKTCPMCTMKYLQS